MVSYQSGVCEDRVFGGDAMRCPKCAEGTRWATIESRAREHYIFRRKECKSCGARFETRETIVREMERGQDEEASGEVHISMEQSLCWECGNACTNGCSWSKSLIPVEGWIANVSKDNDSFQVLQCPEYKQDERIKELDDGGVNELAAGIMRQIINEYIRSSPDSHATRTALIREVRGPVFRMFCSVEPERLIRLMQEKYELVQEEKKKGKKKDDASGDCE